MIICHCYTYIPSLPTKKVFFVYFVFLVPKSTAIFKMLKRKNIISNSVKQHIALQASSSKDININIMRPDVP